MAIFRCNQCNYLREVPAEHVGKIANCPSCQHPGNHIFDTVDFVGQMFEHYQALQKNFLEMRTRLMAAQKPAVQLDASTPSNLNIHNSAALADEAQYGPARDWFARRQIQVEVDQAALSTEGFFDEVAVELGDHYALLGIVVERIKLAQLKNSNHTTIKLGDYPPHQVEYLQRFCRQLHGYSFISRYKIDRNKPDLLHLNLQDAKPITRFFAGEWLEWYVYVRVLDALYKAGRRVSCLKSFTVTWQNGEQNEFDLFFLLDGKTPLVVECKSGDYRAYLQKSADLRKRLKLDKGHFILLVAGLDKDMAAGLSATFDVTVANEANAVSTVLKLIESA